MIRAKIIYSIIIVVLLAIIGWSTYYTLGGFDPVEVYVENGAERTVIGKEYLEKYDYEEFHAKMQETISQIDSGRLKGMLTVIFFEDESIGKDSVHYFLGASVDEIKNVVRLPAGYEYREFETSKVFKVFITQHFLVRPSPEKINELMEIRAIEEGVVLQPVSFEVYYKDQSLRVERWAR